MLGISPSHGEIDIVSPKLPCLQPVQGGPVGQVNAVQREQYVSHLDPGDPGTRILIDHEDLESWITARIPLISGRAPRRQLRLT